MRLLGLFILFLAPCSIALGQRSDDDALRLLDRVVAHYQNAETVHLEATVRAHFQTELSDQTSTSIFSVYTAPGGRFRYEGAVSSGSGLIVSDGTNEWRLLNSLGEYAEELTGTYFASRIAYQSDDRAIMEARDLLRDITALGTSTDAAHFSPNELVESHGAKVNCVVVHFGRQDSTDPRLQSDSKFETVVWIDPSSLKIFKTERRNHSRIMYGMHPAPYGRISESTITTTYEAVNLGFEPKPDTFTFAPPKDAREVAKLPSPFPENTADSAPKGPTPAEQLSIDHIGKPLPVIVFHDNDGNDIPLTRYAGRPLLIDLWATWCGPCISELPILDRIRKSTEKTHLQMIAIDEDTQPGIAASLLKRRGYDWQDFHFNHTVSQGLPTTGVPLIVLADGTGKIVYYHTGADDPNGLAQAIAKLGKEYESVSAQ